MIDDPQTPVPDMDSYSVVGSVLVIIPTYNEVDNVALIVERVRESAPSVHVLVVDDSSPDGTGEIADRIAEHDRQVHVLHREKKEGLGQAYLAGFAWARENGFDVACEMDADGSHAPEQLHRLLDALVGADLVIGSRYVPGGMVVNWPAHRQFISRGGNLYTRLAMGLGIKDATAGYRAYRMPVLDKITADWTPPQGYCFQIELAWRAVTAGFSVKEVPITFAERERGESKMSGSVVREALWRITTLGAATRFRRVTTRVTGRKPAPSLPHHLRS